MWEQQNMGSTQNTKCKKKKQQTWQNNSKQEENKRQFVDKDALEHELNNE